MWYQTKALFEEEFQSLFSSCSRQSFDFTCQFLLEIDHSIPSLVNVISNVARLLWLFEGTDWRTDTFKGGANGMTWYKHENMESFQGSVTSFQESITRSRVRKIEEET
ncbi:hypothetical protein M9H77_16281 [Catharanthus roseus]|uniref:Uncharacterized protein n=1 Tax=Catharanthus roseus TaxID=4058 RepID=A0ACC0B1C5_CATRO|nr:hypothetical protein M9H77_16281 [Catharanthus roseus]